MTDSQVPESLQRNQATLMISKKVVRPAYIQKASLDLS